MASQLIARILVLFVVVMLIIGLVLISIPSPVLG
jgi:hypothetical protein